MWEEIDIGVIEDLLEHWKYEPPIAVVAAALAGFKPPPRGGDGSTRTTGANKVRELFSLFPSGVIRAG